MSRVNSALHVRWMIRRDLSEMLVIERQSFDVPWTEDEFLTVLRGRNVVGMAADLNGEVSEVAGYVIYESVGRHLEILNLAVARRHRRKGIGGQIIDQLKQKIMLQGRKSIHTRVRESNLDAHLFFQRQGFRAVRVIRDHFDNGEAAYHFVFDNWQCS
jgi:ribosomal-protein-alanine N-acetyltransferase